MIKFTLPLVIFALFASCETTPSRLLHSEALSESLLFTSAEPYEHAASQTVFPVRVAEFERKRIVQYDEAAYDIAVSYEQLTSQGVIAVTFYLYPNEVGTTENAMGRATAGILRANPGSEIHSEGLSPLLSDQAGLQATITSPRTSSFGDTTVISEAHAFVLDEIWLFKVRASYAPELWEVAQVELKKLTNELELPSSSVAK